MRAAVKAIPHRRTHTIINVRVRVNPGEPFTYSPPTCKPSIVRWPEEYSGAGHNFGVGWASVLLKSARVQDPIRNFLICRRPCFNALGYTRSGPAKPGVDHS